VIIFLNEERFLDEARAVRNVLATALAFGSSLA